jgi:ATP-binding protein involved in chromosome partitioning
VLGQIPLRSTVRIAGDAGQPIALSEEEAAKAFHGIARRVAEKLDLVVS